MLKPAAAKPSTDSSNTTYHGSLPGPPSGQTRELRGRKVVMFIMTEPEPGSEAGLRSQVVPAGAPLQAKLIVPWGTPAVTVKTNVAVSPCDTVTLALPARGVIVRICPAWITAMVEVPVIAGVTVSVAVMVWFPAVFKVAENVPTPLVSVESTGNTANASLLVKCAVPA